MNYWGKSISPFVAVKVGSHLILCFFSIFGQANSSGTSSRKRQMSQEAGLSCAFRTALQKIYNWLSGGCLSPLGNC